MLASNPLFLAVERRICTFYKTSCFIYAPKSDVGDEIFVSVKVDRMEGPLPSAGGAVDVLSCRHSMKKVNVVLNGINFLRKLMIAYSYLNSTSSSFLTSII